MSMTNTDLPGVELVAAQPLSPEEARRAMDTYQAISRALIDPAEDLQTIGTGKFPKRSALQKLANAYRVSTQILRRELTHDADGALVRCDALVRATHPDGRFAEGDGACAVTEKRFRGTGAEKIDHDLPATAVTRATNRAISNLIAFGAVSAEEAEGADGSGAPGEDRGTARPVTTLPAWAVPVDDVSDVAGTLVDLLKAANVTDAADHVGALGQWIFDNAEGGIPRIVAGLIDQMLVVVAANQASRAVEGTETPADGQEGVTP